MRYYIKASLDVKFESKGFLPGSFDFKMGAILADETTGIFINPSEFSQQIGGNTWNELETASKWPLFGR